MKERLAGPEAGKRGLISETLQSIERHVIEWYFGKGVEPLAYIQIQPPVREDKKFVLEAGKALADAGVRIAKKDYLERLGFAEADADEPALGEDLKSQNPNPKQEKKEDAKQEESNYDPNQPRSPKGSDDGGRWTAAGGGGSKSARAERGPMREGTDEDRARLKVPPAYTDLMVADDPDADLLGVAKKPDGSDWPVYSEEFNAANAEAKWRRIVDMDAEFDSLAARMDADIDAGGADAGSAAALRLIRQTGMRNGGDGASYIPILGEDGAPLRDAKNKILKTKIDTFGASNLRGTHVTVDGDNVRLNFPGKKGVNQSLEISDPVLARHLAPSAGRDAKAFATTDAKTLKYLGKISGSKYKVHDFRSYHATLTAEAAVNAAGGASFEAGSKELRKFQLEIAKPVSEALGNSPAVALKNYIHPGVFANVIKKP